MITPEGMLNTVQSFTYIGYMLGLAGGFIIATIILGLASIVLGIIGNKVYRRVKRIYQLETIWYYLHRMEAEGTHAFTRPDPDEDDEEHDELEY